MKSVIELKIACVTVARILRNNITKITWNYLGGNSWTYGYRTPALTVKQRPDMQLEFASAINNNPNYVKMISAVNANTDYHVIIQQRYIGNGVYEFTALLNGNLVMRVENTKASQFYDVKVHASTKLSTPCDATISGFKVTNFL